MLPTMPRKKRKPATEKERQTFVAALPEAEKNPKHEEDFDALLKAASSPASGRT